MNVAVRPKAEVRSTKRNDCFAAIPVLHSNSPLAALRLTAEVRPAKALVRAGFPPFNPCIPALQASTQLGVWVLFLAAVIPSKEQFSDPPNCVTEVANQLLSLSQIR